MQKVQQKQDLSMFLKKTAEISPYFVVLGIILSFLFCLAIDVTFFNHIFYSVFFGWLGWFAASFIFIIRGTLLFHSYNGFSHGKNGMGTLSVILQICAVLWVCYEAPKVAEILLKDIDKAIIQVSKDAAINLIRVIAGTATFLEFLLIMSINSEDEDQSTPTPTQNNNQANINQNRQQANPNNPNHVFPMIWNQSQNRQSAGNHHAPMP